MKQFFNISRNSEAFASRFLGNHEELFHWYKLVHLQQMPYPKDLHLMSALWKDTLIRSKDLTFLKFSVLLQGYYLKVCKGKVMSYFLILKIC